MPSPKRKRPAEDVRIEHPSVGTTYHRAAYGVYRYDVFPPSSVLAGQRRRSFLASFTTLAEARAAFPHAEYAEHTGYAPASLDHLPDEDA